MPVVANVNLLAGTKSSSTCTTDAADSFCLCRNEAQRLFFLEGVGGEVWHVWDSKQIVVHKNVRHRLEKWRRVEGEMKWDRLAERGAALCLFNLRLLTVKWPARFLAAATSRCCAELCLTDDSTLEDTVLRLPQNCNESCAIFLLSATARVKLYKWIKMVVWII